jgi:hypothetical protein
VFLLSYPTIEAAFYALYQNITPLRHRAIHESWRDNDRNIQFVSKNKDVQELPGKQLDLLLVASLLFMSALVGNEDPLESSQTLHTLTAVLGALHDLHNISVAMPVEEWWYVVLYQVSPNLTSVSIDIDSVMQLFAERGALPPASATIRYNFLVKHPSQDKSVRISEEKVKAGGRVTVKLGTTA